MATEQKPAEKNQLNFLNVVRETYKLAFSSPIIILQLALIIGTVEVLHKLIPLAIFYIKSPHLSPEINGVPQSAFNVIKFSYLGLVQVGLNTCISIGAAKIFLTRIRKKEPSLHVMLEPFKKIPNIYLGTMILFVCSIAAMIPPIALLGFFKALPMPFDLIGLALFVAMVVYLVMVIISYGFFGLVLVEVNDISAIGALKRSRKMVRPFISDTILCLITLIITMLPLVLPLSFAFHYFGGGSVVYNNLADYLWIYVRSAFFVIPNIMWAILYNKIFD